MEERNWSVYIHINKINGKMYVGITSIDPIKRWGKNGICYKTQNFWSAIEKYGWDNFKHIILYQNFTEEQAKYKEKLLIKLFHTYINDEKSNGYNLTLGGDGTVGYFPSEKTKQKLRESHLGQKAWNKGLKYKNPRFSKHLYERWENEEYRRKMSESHLGNKQSEQTKMKISKNSARAISVLKIDLKGNVIKEYNRITEAVQEGYNSSSISSCCTERVLTHKNYIWIYKKDYTKEYIQYRIDKIKNANSNYFKNKL